MIALVSLGALLVMLALTIPVAAALGVLGLITGFLFSDMSLSRAIGEISWKATTEPVLFAIPLFILLGEIMLHSGMAERMYASLVKWFSWLPGGLMHSNVAACTMFAATSGSSFATAATVGTVALAQVKKYGYNESLFCGTLAAGGTLGILIPPSINLIVYGVLTGTSIPQLYLAGFVPGLALSLLFMITILVLCLANPKLRGRKVETTWSERFRSLPHLIPPLLIFAITVGSIYVGIATPTEAAALGVLFVMGYVIFTGRCSLRMLREVCESTMRITGIGIVIVMAAYYLNFVMSLIGLTGQLNTLVTSLSVTPEMLLFLVVLFYLVLGMVMETLSLMIATVPFVAPVVIAAGYDPVWFGIIMMLLIETAMISPPVGTNLFVIQAVRGHGKLSDVIVGALPFVVSLMVMVGLLVAFPQIALWLPELLSTRAGQ